MSRRHCLGMLGLVAVLILALHSRGLDAASEVEVRVVQHPIFGRILADREGRSLYLFAQDSRDGSTCYEECAVSWPPLLVNEEATPGSGVAPTLLGTIRRDDGTVQVTYNGWPLYYHATDEASGETAGQGVGGAWFLISPYGVAVEPREPEPAEPETPRSTDETLLASLLEEGEPLFAAHCAVCHGEQGQGGAGPRLAGNSRLADGTLVARQIMLGSRFMPRFDDTLSNREVAAVATYIRNTWGNEYGEVLEEEAARYR